jgi:hypothetical protein
MHFWIWWVAHDAVRVSAWPRSGGGGIWGWRRGHLALVAWRREAGL